MRKIPNELRSQKRNASRSLPVTEMVSLGETMNMHLVFMACLSTVLYNTDTNANDYQKSGVDHRYNELSNFSISLSTVKSKLSLINSSQKCISDS
jgi:hypothetical protein